MLRALRNLSLWLFVGAAIWWLWPAPPLRHPYGRYVAASPFQSPIPARVLGKRGDYTLTAVARYGITARVLRTKRYHSQGDDLVPYDVALGWGAMSDQAVLDRLKISQGNRFFFYQWRDVPPIPPFEMTVSAANVHVIAADGAVAPKVRRLRAGQFVEMHGYLVNATRPDGFHWKTSLRRDDSGKGACELFYVESIRASDALKENGTLPGSQLMTRVSLQPAFSSRARTPPGP